MFISPLLLKGDFPGNRILGRRVFVSTLKHPPSRACVWFLPFWGISVSDFLQFECDMPSVDASVFVLLDIL